MTETSVEFAKLELSIAEAYGLVKDVPAHDLGSRLDQLKLRSYVLICHASIEEYLENISIAVLRESLIKFKTDGLVRHCLFSTCLHYSIAFSVGTSDTGKSSSFDFLDRVFYAAISEHTKSLNTVNGIKTKDQDLIFLPMGVRLHDFDKLLSWQLNSFGAFRGGIAHSMGAKLQIPMAGQVQTVHNMLRLLQLLDNHLCDLHRITYVAYSK